MPTTRRADRSLARQVMVLQALLVCLMVLAGLALLAEWRQDEALRAAVAACGATVDTRPA